MSSETSGLLKREKVKITGRQRLDSAAPGVTPSVRPRACIVEQDDQNTIIEVVCHCGEKIYLHCTYAGPTGQSAG